MGLTAVFKGWCYPPDTYLSYSIVAGGIDDRKLTETVAAFALKPSLTLREDIMRQALEDEQTARRKARLGASGGAS
jgi:hypothetical protein